MRETAHGSLERHEHQGRSAGNEGQPTAVSFTNLQEGPEVLIERIPAVEPRTTSWKRPQAKTQR